MSHILKIDSSARSQGSASRELTTKIAEKLGGASTTRDLGAAPLPQVSEAWLGANWTPADDKSDAQKALLAQSDALIAELQAADTVVIGVAMYNFGIPAGLKAWVDLVCRAGLTFEYTPEGPKGLLSGKRAIVALATGGVPMGSPMDHASTYMTTMLGFIGITDVTFVSAEGTAHDLDGALKAAEDQIKALAA
jgi:FMN-dependent NADH-azoreductase